MSQPVVVPRVKAILTLLVTFTHTHSFMLSNKLFIHSFSKYPLNPWSVPGPVFSAMGTEINKRCFDSYGVYSLERVPEM